MHRVMRTIRRDGNRSQSNPRVFWGPEGLKGSWSGDDPNIVLNARTVQSANVFNAVWTAARVTLPDANTLRETAAANTHVIYQTETYGGGPKSFSLDVEADGRDWVRIRWSNASVYFNVATGVVGTSVAATGSIAAVPGHAGRWRCTLVPDSTNWAATAVLYIYIADADGSTYYAGDITRGLKVYNTQVYQNTMVSSPAQHTATRVARVQATAADQPVLEPAGSAWAYPDWFYDGTSQYDTADAIAAHFTGDDLPTAVVTAMQWVTHAGNDRGWSLGNSASANGHMSQLSDGTNIDVRRDPSDGTASKDGTGSTATTSRIIWSMDSSGTVVSTYVNSSVDVNAVDIDVNACTMNRSAWGCLRRNTNANFGNVRYGCFHIGIDLRNRVGMENWVTRKYPPS